MAEETIIHSYRVKYDSGLAPCIYDLDRKPTGCLTLACCKKNMRRSIGSKFKDKIANKKADVFVLGVYGVTKLLYFAKITEVVTMVDYFTDSKYKNRLDNIYDVLSIEPLRYKRNKNTNPHHIHPEDCEHNDDWAGEYVLISDCFAYWGKKCPELPQNLLDILPRCKYSFDPDQQKEIIGFVRNQNLWDFETLIQNEPNELKLLDAAR